MPKVSVCIPFYHNEKTIDETLASVKAQTFTDYEIVMVKNIEGLGNALNELVRKAIGEILVFLAADDILLPHAIEGIIKGFSLSPIIGVVTREYYWFIDNYKNVLRKTDINDASESHMLLLCGQISGIGIRKEFIKGDIFCNDKFTEFASGVKKVFDYSGITVIPNYTTAVRKDSSDSCNKDVYKESPTRNWKKILDNNRCLAENYVGLIQVRSYGGIKATIREIKAMAEIAVTWKLVLMSAFVLITPAWLLRFMVRTYFNFMRLI